MVTTFVVGVVAEGHEVRHLDGVPDVHVLAIIKVEDEYDRVHKVVYA